jgi:5-methylcytosine-specific restriction endonuclease McrA
MKDKNKLRRIYDKTDGYCHLCHRKLSFNNHGKHGAKGSWHIEHSVARFNGGSDHLNNRYAACIECNLEKGTMCTQSIRKRNGVLRAPYSKKKKAAIKKENTTATVIVCGGIGLAVGGPVGGLIGTIIGKIIGDDTSPGI